MSDQPDAGPLPELTPEQDRAVARLLAESRHDQPIPADVAARLEDALGELSHADLEGVEEPGEDDDEPEVVDLVGHRRRRRNAGRLLLAAAAVIIVGVGVGQVVSNGSDDESSGSAASSQAIDRGSSDSSSVGSSSGDEAAPPQSRTAVAPVELTGDDPTALASQLTSQLAADPAPLQAAPAPANPERQLQGLQQAAPGYTCASSPAGAYGAGRLLPAYFNGEAVVLALRPTARSRPDATTEADVLECGTGAAVTTFTVQLP